MARIAAEVFEITEITEEGSKCIKKFIFSLTFIAMCITLIIYWVGRKVPDNKLKVRITNEIYKTSPQDNNEMFADGVITTALICGILILGRNLINKRNE